MVTFTRYLAFDRDISVKGKEEVLLNPISNDIGLYPAPWLKLRCSKKTSLDDVMLKIVCFWFLNFSNEKSNELSSTWYYFIIIL